MPHSRKSKRLKQAKQDQCDMCIFNNVVLNYTTSHHTSLECEPSRVFPGRVPYNVLDLKMGICPQINPTPNSQFTEDVLKQTQMIFKDVQKNTMKAHIKYKAYIDKKANASKYKEEQYVYVLQPKAEHEGSKIPFTDFRWVGLFFVEKALPNNNSFGPKTRNKQKPSPSLHETKSIHAQTTHTRRTNNITRMAT